jgi:hypothetical protein
MPVENAIVARSQPNFMAARARELIGLEAAKGCSPIIYSSPVTLEPPYAEIISSVSAIENIETADPGVLASGNDRFESLIIRVSPGHPHNWVRSELFIKGLISSKHLIGLEIIGNCDNIELRFFAHKDDLTLLQTAFKSQHNDCELVLTSPDPRVRAISDACNKIYFLDYYPEPPYSHLFTQPYEFKISPFELVLESLGSMPSSVIGFYQVLFHGTEPKHDWHRNISVLNDIEFALKLVAGSPMAPRFPTQTPSGELRSMALDDQCKAHNDKPIFTAAMRVGAVGPDADKSLLAGLDSFAGLFQHGGRPLKRLDCMDYMRVLREDQVLSMINFGEIYRHGFLLNSSELCGMIHIPPGEYLKRCSSKISVLNVPQLKNADLLEGTPIGTANYRGSEVNLCIPAKTRLLSTHLIAKSGMGKSTVMEHMALHDISTGAGVAILDPHGGLVYRMLNLLPDDVLDRVIYLCWSDPEWVPLWNPLYMRPGQDPARTADEIVSAVKSIVQGWGDRLENLLRHAIYGLLHIEGSNFQDVADILRRKSVESNELISKILDVVDSWASKQFWKHDFIKYSNQDLAPPQHKLSKLLLSGTVSLTLSQPENRINLRDIMDAGKILLVDLSGIGTDVGSLLGSFILSLFRVAAIGRSDIPYGSRKEFHLFCDEAHKFLTTSLEDIIPEARKFKVGLTLAHQYLRQFSPEKRDSILTAGTTIIFNVDLNDAAYLVKDLEGEINPSDLAGFKLGDAVARIGTDVVKISTKEPSRFLENSSMQKIIEESHRRYYMPVRAIRELISRRKTPHFHRYTLADFENAPDDVKLKFDQFD